MFSIHEKNIAPAFLVDKQLWSSFNEEVLSWDRTPFRHLQRTKGVAVDCGLLIGEVLKNTGIFESINYPKYYGKHWYDKEDENVLCDSLEENFEKNSAKQFVWKRLNGVGDVRGDILLFQFRSNRSPHHSAILLEDNTIFHVHENTSARTEKFSDKMKKYCRFYYRLYLEK